MRNIVLVMTLIVISLTGCGSSNPTESSGLEKYDVSQRSDETQEDDFIFRLVSGKSKYEHGEKVKLYGELEYVGDKDEVTINHSSSAILFPMEEKVRGFKIGSAVNDIGLSTTLKKGEPYREGYKKSGGYSPTQDPKDYVKFMQDFFDRDDFPSGYYVVNGFADFSVGSGQNGDEKRYKIKAKIDFKVLK